MNHFSHAEYEKHPGHFKKQQGILRAYATAFMNDIIYTELNGLSLRKLITDDAQRLALFADNRNIWRNLRDYFPFPYTLKHAEEFISRTQAQTPPCSLCISWNNELIGIVGIIPQADVYCCSAEFGYWIAEPYWAKGIGSATARAAVPFFLREFRLARLQACVYAWNPASGKILEKAGFTPECIARQAVFKDGQLIDEHRYYLLADDYYQARIQ